MALDDVSLLKARLNAFITILENTPPANKGNHTSRQIAENFNEILNDIGAKFPDVKGNLPQQIMRRATPAERLGKSSVTFLDIEIMAQQVINILNVLEAGS